VELGNGDGIVASGQPSASQPAARALDAK
jgi:hypothetical protein